MNSYICTIQFVLEQEVYGPRVSPDKTFSSQILCFYFFSFIKIWPFISAQVLKLHIDLLFT